MLFKVDENLHDEVAALLKNAGHDAMTVAEQRLQGHPDRDVADVCRLEGRAILTLDLDFANILRFPPHDYAGIIVMRLNDQSRASVLAVVQRLIPDFTTRPLMGCLWIVDEVGTRVRQGTTP